MTKDHNALMSGRTYLYNGRECTVQQVVHIEDDLFDVHTDQGTKRVNERDLKKAFLPVHGTNGSGQTMALIRAMKENMPMTQLSDTLLDTIEKVKADPKYVDQARAINETAKSLIEIGKLQVEIVRTAKGR